MNSASALVIRNVEVEGRPGRDVLIENGLVARIGARLPSAARAFDGHGGALIPGLADHHIHLMASAAQEDSVHLNGVGSKAELAVRIAAAVSDRPVGAWLRAVGYHETMAGQLTRHELDTIAPRHRLRVQHQSGSLWVLNSAALNSTLAKSDTASCIERDAENQPTGRIWRGDVWLRERIKSDFPQLRPIGRLLAKYGITAVTDASVTTDATSADRLSEAFRNGDMPQRLTLMSAGPLVAPVDGAYTIGPVKILLDDHNLPDLGDFVARIALAQKWGRPVAVHCVTAAELALALAAFKVAGTFAENRIEHGGIIVKEAIPQLRALGLTVITQPSFIRERGDRYAAEIHARERDNLYRCGSLLAAAVRVAAGSDAPYASADPWASMRTAIERRTRTGRTLGAAERVTPEQALRMYLGQPAVPGRTIRRVAVGARADLCLLKAPLRDVLEAPNSELVQATLLGGSVIYEAP